jgi:Tol biopolymer transport system component
VPAAVDFPARFSVMPPPGYRFVLNAGHSVSPDGRRLAMILLNLQATSRQIWVRDLDSTKMEPLAGTEGAYALFWSPDSRSIGFRGEGKLKRVDLDGHQVQSICDAPGSADGATWNAEGTILFGLFGRPIMRVNASGGTPTPAVGDSLDVGKLTEGYPQFLPDGRHFLFAVARSGQKDGIYAASLDGKEPARRILESAIEAIFAADSDESKGYLFFKRQNTVMAIRFDAGKLAVSGDPFVVIESGGPSSIRLPVSVSSPARVIVWREDSDGQMDAAELVMLDRAGTRLASIGAGSGAAHVELSPDGTRLLAERTDPRTANAGLWTFDLGRKVASRLSFGNGNQGPAVWSADGQKILFFAESDGVAGLYAAPSDGSGRPDLFFKGGLHHLHASADGKYVAFEAGVAGASDIHLLDLQKGGERPILIKSTAAVSNPQFSPDGRWLAYSSLEGAQRELFVQSFPAGGGRWQVSNAGETVARWRHDGRELVYYDGKGHVLAVSVALRGSALELGTPVKLFDANFMNGYFAMSGDGQRFYANMMPVTTERTVEAVPLTVILNWSAGLKR